MTSTQYILFYPQRTELVFQALETETLTLFIRMTNMLSVFCYALFHLTDSDSESEGMDVGSSRTPILVISGEPGLGKTTCVYTMSSMQDFKVIISPFPIDSVRNLDYLIINIPPGNQHSDLCRSEMLQLLGTRQFISISYLCISDATFLLLSPPALHCFHIIVTFTFSKSWIQGL